MGLLRDLYRGLRIAWHKPGHWQLRQATYDRHVFRTVAVENEYRLPERLHADDVVLDIGANIGAFAYAALQRGAGLVCCYEPDADNFHQLSHNLRPYQQRVRLFRCAVWRSDARVQSLSLRNPCTAAHTGSLQVTSEPATQSVPALAFDNLVRQATAGERRIRLLKLDCEGAEWPILLTATTLDRIDALCGEYHLADYPEAFQVAGVPAFTAEILERFLRDQAFHVVLEGTPSLRPGSHFDSIGHFFAQRSAAVGPSRARSAAK
jgi:FkbM family methyltransferase